MAFVAPIVAAGAAIYGMTQQQKAQKKAQEQAQQQQSEARAEQQRIEQKFALTPEEESSQSGFLRDLERRRALGGEQLLRETGPITQSLLDRIAREQGMTGRELFLAEGGPAGAQYLERIERPGASETFNEELELVRQMVNAEANKRGVFGGLPEGGIRFEQLGRAGVDLAIKSARESLAQKQAASSMLINLAQNVKSEAGRVGESGIDIQNRARDELERFLSRREGIASNVSTSAFGTAQNAVNQASGAQQEIFGAQAEQGAGLARTGIGGLTDIIIGQPTTGGAGIPPQQTYFTPRTQELGVGENIGLRTGRSDYLDDEYQRIRRQRRGY